MAKKIPCVYMRGGTSKACIFHAKDLPKDQQERDNLLLRIYGSPDINQVDGMGGATITTSKTAIVSPSQRNDADVDYFFGQVGIDQPYVDGSMNCGNISSAIGPFAIDEGLITPVEPITAVRIFNINTGKVIVAHVPVKHGAFDSEGSFSIDGVPGTASEIKMEFFHPQGAATGKLLPTGNPIDTLEIDGQTIEYSFIDAANPIVFVLAEQFGLSGSETPAEYEKLPNLAEIRRKLEIVRGTCAVAAGFAKNLDDAKENSQVVPKIVWCAPPVDYVGSDGKSIGADSIDFVGRFITMKGKMNVSFAGTAGICVGVAANVSGSVLDVLLKKTSRKIADDMPEIRIGHPCGVMKIEAVIHVGDDGKREVASCLMGRTARRLMDGHVYVPDGL